MVSDGNLVKFNYVIMFYIVFIDKLGYWKGYIILEKGLEEE